jgi:hypothetical protein
MSPAPATRSVWRMALMPVLGGVLMCIVAATLVVGVNWLADNTANEQSRAQTALTAAERALKKTQLDMARLDDNLQTYDKLKQSGFLGVQDRLGLVEALEDAAKELHQSAFEWELGPEEKMQVLIDSQTGEKVSQLMRIPMKLSASGIHEEEWLQLLARLQTSGAGSFVTNTCVYEPSSYSAARSTAPAVKVACDLSWLFVVAEGTKR